MILLMYFFIGEAEESICEMLELIQELEKRWKTGGRKEIIRRMAAIEGAMCRHYMRSLIMKMVYSVL